MTAEQPASDAPDGSMEDAPDARHGGVTCPNCRETFVPPAPTENAPPEKKGPPGFSHSDALDRSETTVERQIRDHGWIVLQARESRDENAPGDDEPWEPTEDPVPAATEEIAPEWPEWEDDMAPEGTPLWPDEADDPDGTYPGSSPSTGAARRPRRGGRVLAVLVILLLLAGVASAAVTDTDDDGFTGAAELQGGTNPFSPDDADHATVVELHAYLLGNQDIVGHADAWEQSGDEITQTVDEALDWITPVVDVKRELQGRCVQTTFGGRELSRNCAWDLVETGAPSAALVFNAADNTHRALQEMKREVASVQFHADYVGRATQAFLLAPGYETMQDVVDAYDQAESSYARLENRFDDIADGLRSVEERVNSAQRTIYDANRFDLLDSVFNAAASALQSLEDRVDEFRSQFSTPAGNMRDDMRTMDRSQAIAQDDSKLLGWTIVAVAAFLALAVLLVARRARRRKRMWLVLGILAASLAAGCMDDTQDVGSDEFVPRDLVPKESELPGPWRYMSVSEVNDWYEHYTGVSIEQNPGPVDPDASYNMTGGWAAYFIVGEYDGNDPYSNNRVLQVQALQFSSKSDALTALDALGDQACEDDGEYTHSFYHDEMVVYVMAPWSREDRDMAVERLPHKGILVDYCEGFVDF